MVDDSESDCIEGMAANLSVSIDDFPEEGSRVVRVGMISAGSVTWMGVPLARGFGMRSTASGPILQLSPDDGTWTDRVMALILEWYSAWYLILSDEGGD